MVRESVKITNAALDNGPNNSTVLRGIVEPDSLKLLVTPPYQRDVMPFSTIRALMDAQAAGNRLPDIELAMRGETFREREGGIVYLQGEVYIIDGLQRVNSGLSLIQAGDGVVPRLGAVVHFNTTEEWERERFRILNSARTKVSPNVLLRNLQHEVELVRVMHDMSVKEKAFVLCGRVSWDQRVQRHQVITALTFLKTVGALHSHMGAGRSAGYLELARGVERIYQEVGKTTFRANINTFFDVIDECWGVKAIAFREGAAYMRSTFLLTLAAMLSGHLNFWKDNRLVVEKDLRRKLAGFPVTDPQVRQLAGAGGQAGNLLLGMMLRHVNSGKRTRRLEPRDGSMVVPDSVDESTEEGDGGENGK